MRLEEWKPIPLFKYVKDKKQKLLLYKKEGKDYIWQILKIKSKN